MMLPFPQSPLSFRTVGLPQYGWKVGLSDSAFTHVALVKPTPGILSVTSALRLPFMHSVASPDVPLWVGTVCSVVHCHRSEEHTSELQSHVNLVCRLLLEKKK